MSTIRIGKKTYKLPGSRILRTLLGLVLILGGLLWFLPVVGFWMLPLGLAVLSIDFPFVRRLRRRFEVWWFGKAWPRLRGYRERRAKKRAEKK